MITFGAVSHSALAIALMASLNTTHYRLDVDVGTNFGGSGSTTSYRLVDAGGDAVIGTGLSSSYKLGVGYIAQLQQSIQLSVLPTGIAAYYPLDTDSGIQAYDVSTNENRGVITNGPVWTTGKLGRALGFNGSNQYVDIPSSSSTNITGDLTIEAWVNLTNYANANTIVAKTTGNGSANNTYELRTEQTTGKLQFLAFDSALRTVTSSSAVGTSSFVHVAAVKSAGTVTLYINGSANGSPGSVGTSSSNSNAVKIGARDDLTNFAKGTIDEVKIYGRALSAREIANEYTAGVAGIASGQTIPDVVPNVSQATSIDAIVRTDAGGYDLAIQQDHDLRHTDTTTTIAGISGSIASPILWSEGTTKGLGFSLVDGANIESSWGTSPNYKYAAIPTTATTLHSRTGFLAGLGEKNTVQFRLDTLAAQKSGMYTNTVTFTATLKP